MSTGDFLTRNGLKLLGIGFIAASLAYLIAGAGLAYADKPSFCGSCHSMEWVYNTWAGSNHKQFTCGDCHLPQEALVAKLYVKAENGIRHTYHEVLRDYPEAIKLRGDAVGIVNKNCLRCHASTVGNTPLSVGGQSCIKCHRGIVHGQNMPRGGVPFEK